MENVRISKGQKWYLFVLAWRPSSRLETHRVPPIPKAFLQRSYQRSGWLLLHFRMRDLCCWSFYFLLYLFGNILDEFLGGARQLIPCCNFQLDLFEDHRAGLLRSEAEPQYAVPLFQLDRDYLLIWMGVNVRRRSTWEIISRPMHMVRSLSLWICTKGKMVNFSAGRGAVGVIYFSMMVQEGWGLIRVVFRVWVRLNSIIAIGFVRRDRELWPLFGPDWSYCWREYLFIRLNVVKLSKKGTLL